jgi:LytS/YehU family sensor histidine kinase
VRWNVDRNLEDRMVPSFVLQPLVENAIRHGFTDPSRALTIDVAIVRNDGGLVLRVEDDGEGLTRSDLERPAEGIGLGHTRARLAGLYGDRASLILGPSANGRGVRVMITIPTT